MERVMRHPEYYRGRADFARVIAKVAIQDEARKALLNCADEYEELAAMAEKGNRHGPVGSRMDRQDRRHPATE